MTDAAHTTVICSVYICGCFTRVSRVDVYKSRALMIELGCSFVLCGIFK